jgi:hypothetical protein
MFISADIATRRIGEFVVDLCRGCAFGLFERLADELSLPRLRLKLLGYAGLHHVLITISDVAHRHLSRGLYCRSFMYCPTYCFSLSQNHAASLRSCDNHYEASSKA